MTDILEPTPDWATFWLFLKEVVYDLYMIDRLKKKSWYFLRTLEKFNVGGKTVSIYINIGQTLGSSLEVEHDCLILTIFFCTHNTKPFKHLNVPSGGVIMSAIANSVY